MHIMAFGPGRPPEERFLFRERSAFCQQTASQSIPPCACTNIANLDPSLPAGVNRPSPLPIARFPLSPLLTPPLAGKPPISALPVRYKRSRKHQPTPGYWFGGVAVVIRHLLVIYQLLLFRQLSLFR